MMRDREDYVQANASSLLSIQLELISAKTGHTKILVKDEQDGRDDPKDEKRGSREDGSGATSFLSLKLAVTTPDGETELFNDEGDQSYNGDVHPEEEIPSDTCIDISPDRPTVNVSAMGMDGPQPGWFPTWRRERTPSEGTHLRHEYVRSPSGLHAGPRYGSQECSDLLLGEYFFGKSDWTEWIVTSYEKYWFTLMVVAVLGQIPTLCGMYCSTNYYFNRACSLVGGFPFANGMWFTLNYDIMSKCRKYFVVWWVMGHWGLYNLSYSILSDNPMDIIYHILFALYTLPGSGLMDAVPPTIRKNCVRAVSTGCVVWFTYQLVMKTFFYTCEDLGFTDKDFDFGGIRFSVWQFHWNFTFTLTVWWVKWTYNAWWNPDELVVCKARLVPKRSNDVLRHNDLDVDHWMVPPRFSQQNWIMKPVQVAVDVSSQGNRFGDSCFPCTEAIQTWYEKWFLWIYCWVVVWLGVCFFVYSPLNDIIAENGLLACVATMLIGIGPPGFLTWITLNRFLVKKVLEKLNSWWLLCNWFVDAVVCCYLRRDNLTFILAYSLTALLACPFVAFQDTMPEQIRYKYAWMMWLILFVYCCGSWLGSIFGFTLQTEDYIFEFGVLKCSFHNISSSCHWNLSFFAARFIVSAWRHPESYDIWSSPIVVESPDSEGIIGTMETMEIGTMETEPEGGARCSVVDLGGQTVNSPRANVSRTADAIRVDRLTESQVDEPDTAVEDTQMAHGVQIQSEKWGSECPQQEIFEKAIEPDGTVGGTQMAIGVQGQSEKRSPESRRQKVFELSQTEGPQQEMSEAIEPDEIVGGIQMAIGVQGQSEKRSPESRRQKDPQQEMFEESQVVPEEVTIPAEGHHQETFEATEVGVAGIPADI